MPRRTVPGTDFEYHLVLFDEDGPRAGGTGRHPVLRDDPRMRPRVSPTSSW